jgi:hypothetical protein
MLSAILLLLCARVGLRLVDFILMRVLSRAQSIARVQMPPTEYLSSCTAFLYCYDNYTAPPPPAISFAVGRSSVRIKAAFTVMNSIITAPAAVAVIANRMCIMLLSRALQLQQRIQLIWMLPSAAAAALSCNRVL